MTTRYGRRGDPGEAGGEVRRRPPSPIPWVMAGVTVLLLGAIFVLDQWATTRVDLSMGGRTATLAVHYGRSGITQAAEAAELSRGTAFNNQSYEELYQQAREDRVQPIRTTRTYGTLIVVLTAAACALRLISAGWVTKLGSMRGGAAYTYIGASVLVGALAVVAVLFNTSGLVGDADSASWSLLGENARHGFGISAWGAIGAFVLDALGIFIVKAGLMGPVRRPSGGRRRRRR